VATRAAKICRGRRIGTLSARIAGSSMCSRRSETARPLMLLEENPELPRDEALAGLNSGENASEPGRTVLDESARKEAN
jgi:hypothetical protein